MELKSFYLLVTSQLGKGRVQCMPHMFVVMLVKTNLLQCLLHKHEAPIIMYSTEYLKTVNNYVTGFCIYYTVLLNIILECPLCTHREMCSKTVYPVRPAAAS